MTVLLQVSFDGVKENLPLGNVQEVELSYLSVLYWRTSSPNGVFTLTFRKWPMLGSKWPVLRDLEVAVLENWQSG